MAINTYNIPDIEGDDTGDVGICVFDEKGRFLYTNEAFLQIRGTTLDHYHSITPEDMYKKNLTDKCILNSVFTSKTPITDVQTVLREDGKILRKQLVTIYPIFDENGNIKNAIAYYRDLASVSKNSRQELGQKPVQRAAPQKSTVIVSPSMKALYDSAQKVAAIDSTILITGETGTGKEVLARYIHNASPRQEKEMVVVDCTALPDSLIESELFGYEKGSFTGAATAKVGLIESANGSTLFLDEINSLPLSLQGKLLRTLETKTIKHLGALKAKPVDFRLIAATNVDLLQCVADKTFRSDLYYRLNVIPFHIPPLRKHREDIVPLVRYFKEYFTKKYGVNRCFSPKVYEELEQNNWVGNVRELKNMVERLVVMGTSSTMTESDFLPQQPAENEEITDERERIRKALELNRGHREKTAQYLHISRRTLQYKLKKYGIY
ncbi:MAG: sigma 54-interacting transcriptional regulator [Intestinimonas sp.]|jgi:PAS domain S-box-containing protein|nr:sigma 54-interacting transcriptional regulator [Intestinimonas sp.]